MSCDSSNKTSPDNEEVLCKLLKNDDSMQRVVRQGTECSLNLWGEGEDRGLTDHFQNF